MRIGINGSDKLIHPDLDRIIADIEASEKAGFTSYWLAQTGLADALAVLAVAGPRTSTITLGTAVVPTWTRHPQAVAALALTTQAATRGRTVLGLGLAHKPTVEANFGMRWQKPIRHILDYLDVLQPLLETGRASHQGDLWSYMGSGGRPTDQPPKVMLAALGEQMLNIAGRRTDGTILWCVGPIALERQIVPIITAAADVAGRPAPSVVCSLPVWVTDDPGPAREFVGSVLRDYGTLPSYRAMLDIEGVNGVADISLIGPEDVVTAGLERIAAAGATDFTAVVMGGNPEERQRTVDVLAAAGRTR